MLFERGYCSTSSVGAEGRARNNQRTVIHWLFSFEQAVRMKYFNGPIEERPLEQSTICNLQFHERSPAHARWLLDICQHLWLDASVEVLCYCPAITRSNDEIGLTSVK